MIVVVWSSMISHLTNFQSRLNRHCVVEATLRVWVVKSGSTALDALHVAVDAAARYLPI